MARDISYSCNTNPWHDIVPNTNPKARTNMDPNATLSSAREAATGLTAAIDAGDTDATLDFAQTLALSFTALDEWLDHDGFLPDAWRQALVPDFGVNPLIDRMLFYAFVTALEGGINFWAACTKYMAFKLDRKTEDPEGFYADVIDADYPEGDPDAEFPPTRIDRALMAKAFERVAAGPIEGWHEDYRSKFLVMLTAALAGSDVDVDYDAYDASGLVQVGLFGKVIFG